MGHRIAEFTSEVPSRACVTLLYVGNNHFDYLELTPADEPSRSLAAPADKTVPKPAPPADKPVPRPTSELFHELPDCLQKVLVDRGKLADALLVATFSLFTFGESKQHFSGNWILIEIKLTSNSIEFQLDFNRIPIEFRLNSK